MNILFSYFIPSGGVETLNRQRFYALHPYNINCHFLYLQEGKGLQNKIQAPIFISNDDKEINHIIKKGDYDAIIVNTDINLLKKIKESGYEGLVIYENQGLGKNKEYADYYIRNHVAPILNQYCDALLYPKTAHLKSAFEKNFPNIQKYCFQNSFDTKDFHYRKIPKHPHPIIGWVGRLEKNKNWREFLTIGATLMKENHNIKLWMFEDSTLAEKEERIAFEKMILKLKLKEKLKVFSNQPHHKMSMFLSEIGDSGGFLCSTSKVEGFGYAVLEAMACKCPVLTTDSDGVRSLIKHNKTGKLYPINHISKASVEAKELMFNYELRDKIRKTGVQHIKRHFSPEQYAEKFIRMINELKQRNK
ncbi:glycosyltransferase family 4 protein [Evansella sp. AB-rgal1]|uniref:glycosyltransferase family 4 protein n=1 Tax=Evansella sp. AB-rgal1 TaxID=3242696 RepID=UPI00359D5DC6